MSNVARVYLKVEPLDYSFLHEEQELAAWFGRVMTSTGGLVVHVRDLGKYRPNEHGGQTAQISLTIEGTEAIWYTNIKWVSDTLRKYGIVEGWYVDLECGSTKPRKVKL